MTSCMQSSWIRWLPLALALTGSGRAAGQEPELLFHVTFDDLTANAQVAMGNPKSTLTRDLGLTAKEGFNKRTALLLGERPRTVGELQVERGKLTFYRWPRWPG